MPDQWLTYFQEGFTFTYGGADGTPIAQLSDTQFETFVKVSPDIIVLQR